MKKILVIGNGFDLNIGLKTSYYDFIQSTEFSEQEKDSLFTHLEKEKKRNSWLDVELELSKYSNAPDESKQKTPDSIYASFELLRKTLIAYLKREQEREIKQESKAYELIKNNFDDETIVINFNYTSTVQKILAREKINYKPEQILHLHGDLINNDIIIGVHDTCEVARGCSFLMKSAHTVDRKILRLESLQNDYKDFHFFGHSLGETDSSYLKTFVERLPSLKGSGIALNVYTHSDGSWFDIHEKLNIYTVRRVGQLQDGVAFKRIRI